MELLISLIEECSEVQKIACKMLRFGPLTTDINGENYDSIKDLSIELDDLAAVRFLLELENLTEKISKTNIKNKLDRLEAHLDHSSSLGRLDSAGAYDNRDRNSRL